MQKSLHDLQIHFVFAYHAMSHVAVRCHTNSYRCPLPDLAAHGIIELYVPTSSIDGDQLEVVITFWENIRIDYLQ